MTLSPYSAIVRRVSLASCPTLDIDPLDVEKGYVQIRSYAIPLRSFAYDQVGSAL